MTTKRFTAAQGLDGNSKSITNVNDPTNAQDVATKAYATNATNLASGTVSASLLPTVTTLAQGAMTAADKTKLDGISAGAGTGTVSSVAALTLGTTGTDVSSTVANGTTTPVITLQIPTASATNRGALSAADWTTFNNKTNNTGTVTGVTATAPVASTGGTAPVISMAAATTSASGHLTSTDWNTFNGKTSNTGTVTSVGGTGTVSGLTLTGTVTTTGSLTLGGTLSLGSLNTLGTAAGLSATLAVGSGGTGVTTLSGVVFGNGTSNFSAATSAQLLTAIGVANTTTSGYLLTADWNTFNGKQAPATTLAGYGITNAYTKTETDTLLQGLDPKASVKIASTAALTLASGFAAGAVIDGYTLVTDNRILIKDQAAGAENGIYTVNATGAPTRATDMDAWTEVPNAYVFVEQGTANADKGFVCTSNITGTIGTDAITWVQFTSAGSYTASTGLTLTSGAFSITNTAVTAQGYGSATQVATFTVNQQGQLTAAGNTNIAIAASAVSGLATSATTNTTDAANISAGTLPAARMPALTGDITTSANAVATTLATVNANVGSFTLASVTVNAKGLITAASSGTAPSGSISVTGGDLTLSGNTGTAITNATLATVNTSTAAVGSTSVVPVITANGKGLVTSITSATITPAAIGALPILTNGNIGSATYTSTATTSAQVVDSNSATVYRSIKYEIQITSTGSYQICEALVIHDGTNATIMEYGNINVGTVTTPLAIFEANISGGNVQLLVTPAQATSTVFKVIKTLINI